MKYLLACVLIVATGVGLTAQQQRSSESLPIVDAQSIRAEEFFRQIFEHVHRRYDFADVPQELFASNWLQSYREMLKEDAFPVGVSPELAAKLTDEQWRKKAIADWNVTYTEAAYVFAAHYDEISEGKLHAEQIYPEAVQRQIKQNEFCGHAGELTSMKEFNRYLEEASKTTALLRAHMPSREVVDASIERLYLDAGPDAAIRARCSKPGETPKNDRLPGFDGGCAMLRYPFVFLAVEENHELRLLGILAIRQC